MHEDIKKFTIEGVIGDEADIVENRETLMQWLEGNLRDDGYAPVLDIDPQHTVEYDVDRNQFRFVLSTYGVYVGKERSWQVAGLMHGKMIMRYIPQAKLKEYWSSAR